MAVRLVVTALSLVIACASTPAGAERPAPCSAELLRWGERCSERLTFRAVVLSCPAGRAIIGLDAGAAGAAGLLRVEAAVGAEKSFRRVGAIGFSPMGSFHDWSSVAAPLRAAFDKLLTCAAETTLPLGNVAAAPVGAPPPPPPPRLPAEVPLPWLLFAGLLAAFGAGWTRPHRGLLRGRAKVWLALLATGGAAVAARALLWPWHYFHQNGQGPLWTQYALCGESPYGPGLHELLGALTGLWPDAPEGAVIGAQAALAGVAVPCVFWLTRGAGASAPLSWVWTLLFAANPIVARLAQSESYYGFQLSLLLIGAAVLAAQARASRWRARSFALAVLAAGLLVAQAARIHPVGWAAAATLPLVLLGGTSSLRLRCWRTLVAGAGIALVTGLAAGEALWETLRGELGDKWGPGTEQGFGLGHDALVSLAWAAALGALLLVAARRRLRALMAVLALLAVAATLVLADLLGQSTEWIRAAYQHLYAPTALALGSALLATLPRAHWQSWVVTGTVGVLGTLGLCYLWPLATTYPTDTLEQRWLIAQREALPRDASLSYVSRAQNHVFVFPAHGTCAPADWRAALDDHDPVDLRRLRPPLAYYRSSLCSTPPGRALCDAVERAFTLEPIATHVLPAQRSLLHLSYDEPSVRVGLYRLHERAGGAAPPPAPGQ